jgi:hypothetical protein
MSTAVDALSLERERADEPGRRGAVMQPVQDRCDAAAFDKPATGQDGFPPYNHRGTIVVACAWLAFYVIVAAHHFTASGH